MARKVFPDVVGGQEVFSLATSAMAREAARGMSERNVNSVLVTAGERLVGIITSTDLVRKVMSAGLDPDTTPVGEVMTPDPQTAAPGSSAIEALHRMHDGHFRHLPVVDNGKIVGVVSRRDFFGYEIDEHEHQKKLWERL